MWGGGEGERVGRGVPFGARGECGGEGRGRGWGGGKAGEREE